MTNIIAKSKIKRHLSIELIFSFFLFLSIFRFPLLAASGLGLLPFKHILSLFPLLLLIFYWGFCITNKKERTTKTSYSSYTILILFLISSSFSLSLLTIGIPIHTIIIHLSGQLSIALLVFILYQTNLSENSYKKILLTISKYTIFIGSIYLISEYTLIHTGTLSPLKIKEWLLQSKSTFEGHLRINGFLISKEISATIILISLGCIYYYSNNQQIWKTLSYTIITIIAILTCDSMTLNVSLAIILFIYLMNRFNFFVTLSTMLISSTIFLHSSTSERLITYIVDSTPISNYLPKFSGCEHYLWGYNSSSMCIAGEIHTLTPIFKYGIMPSLCWILIIIIGIYYLIPQQRFKYKFYLPAMCFTLPMIHYGGAEIWGINYLVALIITYQMKLSSSNNDSNG